MMNKSLIRFALPSLLLNILMFIYIIYDFSYHRVGPYYLLYGCIIIVLTSLFFLSIYLFTIKIKTMNIKNEDILEKYEESEEVKSLILNNSPSGIIVLDSNGVIQYVNDSIGRILGSTETVGLNILEFDTIRKSRMYDGIIRALEGGSVELAGERYTSYTTRIPKVLNVYIYPIIKQERNKKDSVIIIIHDVTREVNLKEEAEAAYVSTIEALAEAVDKRDSYTGQHSKNVVEYSSVLCEHLNLSEEEYDQILIAASVHDIGKIGIEDEILKKPDKLTFEEYNKMKEHSNIGAGIINKLAGFENISNIVRYHHERFDGGGYPIGLKGNEIPLGAQIIAVADTYDAITSNRVYRSSLGKEKAKEILLEEKGKQFNPILVDVFLSKIDKIV